MNRNTMNHFSTTPTVNIPRSKQDLSHDLLTTFNTGELIPIYCDAEIYPGDTVQIDTAGIIRMTTPIYPVMGNAYADTYFFFIPHRLVWDHWREFMGENRQTHWEQPTEYIIPQINAPTGGWTKGSIADYFRIPTKKENFSVNALPFRAYAQVVNDWFLDQNLKNPCMMNKDDATVTGNNGTNYITDCQLGGKPFKAAKFADMFTTCLPAAQKGAPVTISIGGVAPVYAREFNIPNSMSPNGIDRLKFGKVVDGDWAGLTNTGTKTIVMNANTETGNTGGIYTSGSAGSGVTDTMLTPVNLWADISEMSGVTINELRTAFAVQKLLERDALAGTRYIEIIRSHFSVTSPDARMQRAEYLGGGRHIINMSQVLQTSATNTTSPQGNTAAYSLTNFNHSDFTFSRTEHGTILGLMVVRTEHSYQQGLNKMWSAKTRLDYYWPELRNVGNVGVKNKEIFLQGNEQDNEIFGYQERYYNLRHIPNAVTGAMRSNYETSLDAWHYADYYETRPTLSSEWIDETTANVDRTLTVQSSVEDQFFRDIYFKAIYTRPMPVFSIPGLIDHH